MPWDSWDTTAWVALFSGLTTVAVATISAYSNYRLNKQANERELERLKHEKELENGRQNLELEKLELLNKMELEKLESQNLTDLREKAREEVNDHFPNIEGQNPSHLKIYLSQIGGMSNDAQKELDRLEAQTHLSHTEEQRLRYLQYKISALKDKEDYTHARIAALSKDGA